MTMTTPFNESDILVVFEVARIALMNKDTAEEIGDKIDLSSEELNRILQKLEEMMNN